MKTKPRASKGIRLSDAEWQAIEKAAASAKMKPSEWMRAILRKASGLGSASK